MKKSAQAIWKWNYQNGNGFEKNLNYLYENGLDKMKKHGKSFFLFLKKMKKSAQAN